MNKWEEAARSIQREDKYDLDSLPGGVIIRKKFSVEIQEKMMSLSSGVTRDENGVPTDMKPGELVELHEAVIKGGLLEFTFKNEKNEVETVDIEDENFISSLMQYPDVEQEMFAAISAFNRPLAEESESQSETVQNGHSEASNSEEATSSQTAQNRS